jgi:hypothetical protein
VFSDGEKSDNFFPQLVVEHTEFQSLPGNKEFPDPEGVLAEEFGAAVPALADHFLKLGAVQVQPVSFFRAFFCVKPKGPLLVQGNSFPAEISAQKSGGTIFKFRRYVNFL